MVNGVIKHMRGQGLTHLAASYSRMGDVGGVQPDVLFPDGRQLL